MPDFIENPAYEIAQRIELRGASYSWFVVLQPSRYVYAVMDFLNELEAFDVPAEHVELTGMLLDDLRSVLQRRPAEAVILSGLNDRSQDFWVSLDINRS